MYKVMVVVNGPLSKYYFPITQQERKADAERDVEALKAINEGYKFAIMDED